MDYSKLIGKYFLYLDNDPEKIVDVKADYISYTNTKTGKSNSLYYQLLKDLVSLSAVEFIDSHSYEFYGSIVKIDTKSVFDEVEQVNISPGGINHVGTGQFTMNVPKGFYFDPKILNNQNKMPVYKAYDSAMNEYGNYEPGLKGFGIPEVNKKPKCECGAHKIGVSDYQGGHSSWCIVHHDKRK